MAEISDDVRRALGVVGSIKTPRKAAASVANGALGGRPAKAISDYPCTCGAGDSLTGHKTTCPRGLAIRRRERAGKL